MKQIVLSILMILSVNLDMKAQCGAKLKKMTIAYCEGKILSNYEIKTNSIKLKLVLKKETVYGIYLIKEEDGHMPKITINNRDDITMEDFEETTENNDYKYYKFVTPKSGTYKFTVGFDEGITDCALMVICSQTKGNNTKIVIDAREKN